MTDTAKAKPGELRVLDLPKYSARGLFVVVAVGKAFARLRRVDDLMTSLQDIKLLHSELAAMTLPAGREMDLDTPPPEPVAAVAAPAPTPEPLVTISVPDPNRKGYTFPTRDDPNPTIILPEDSPHLNKNKLSRKVIRVRESLVGLVLAGVDGSHLIGEAPRPVQGFVEDDA